MFFTCFASFYYLVIHSILFHYIHAFIWISCAPLIILDHLYVFRVKFSSFLYPLSIMTKRRRNCGEYVVSFFKILHVRGRNAFLCKAEMCFILFGGVLTSLFLYTDLVTLFTYIVLIFDIYIWCMSSSPTFTCVVSFLSLCTCLDEFCLKCFRNTSCQSLLVITLFLQSFSRVCVRIDFIVFNKWIWVEWFMTSLICSFVCCGFVTD